MLRQVPLTCFGQDELTEHFNEPSFTRNEEAFNQAVCFEALRDHRRPRSALRSAPLVDSYDGEAAVQAVRAQWRTRQLLKAAARLMERSGLHGVSMQAVADEASVSVGLIYRYFSSKQDLLLAVILEVIHEFAARVPAAVTRAGDDPVERTAAGFRAYCEVIDQYRHAAVLTYRESRALSIESREQIKELEVRTSDPLRSAIRDAVTAGIFYPVDVDLLTCDLLFLAHAWVLKHWHFEGSYDLDSYISAQIALVLRASLDVRYQRKYCHLIGNPESLRESVL